MVLKHNTTSETISLKVEESWFYNNKNLKLQFHAFQKVNSMGRQWGVMKYTKIPDSSGYERQVKKMDCQCW